MNNEKGQVIMDIAAALRLIVRLVEGEGKSLAANYARQLISHLEGGGSPDRVPPPPKLVDTSTGVGSLAPVRISGTVGA